MRLVIFLLAFLPLYGFTQKLSKADKTIINNLKSHINYLASDELEGRRAGSIGETKAIEYISTEFKKAGLIEKGEQGFVQPFKISDGKGYTKSTFLEVNGYVLQPLTDFFTLFNTDHFKLKDANITVPLSESGTPWFLDLGAILDENKDNPHFDTDLAIKEKIKNAISKGAAAFFIYNTSDLPDNLKFDAKDKSERPSIPIVYIKKASWIKYFSESLESIDLNCNVQFEDLYRTANNVIGYIDNKAIYNVVIGAHFDHLGYGQDGNSMIRNGEPAIHNGADDNASGTAALIELSRLIKKQKIKKYNFIFSAFSGEELGLNGSKYFTEHATIDLANTSFMINMDMVGRLNDSSNTITIGGYGTSAKWNELIDLNSNKSFKVRIDSSGSGPSDHTSFYRKNIPVLFFFTGLHSDYHKPSDDANKINFDGELKIVKYINDLIRNEKLNGKIDFLKTREAQSSSNVRFSVSLGVMPDYTFSGLGVRIDGVSEGKLAQKLGLKAGDILIKLGDYDISSVEAYMKVLSKFKKGDQTILTIKRNGEYQTYNIQF